VRLAVLLPLLSGACQVVFPLDGTPAADGALDDAPASLAIERGPKLVGVRTSSNLVELARPADLEDADLVIVTIQGRSHSNQLMFLPTGFTQLSNGIDTCGGATWQLWVIAGRAGELTSLDFTFGNGDMFIGFGTTYRNAGRITELDFASSVQDLSPRTVPLASVEGVAEGTLIYLILAGHDPITEEPEGLSRVGEFDRIVIYDEPAVDGVIKQINVPVPVQDCIGIVEAQIDP
jgi:hypothetical protein